MLTRACQSAYKQGLWRECVDWRQLASSLDSFYVSLILGFARALLYNPYNTGNQFLEKQEQLQLNKFARKLYVDKFGKVLYKFWLWGIDLVFRGVDLSLHYIWTRP